MTRAGALRRPIVGLLLVAAAALGTSGCILAPAPGPVVGPPVVVAPAPFLVVPRRPHYHDRGGYYHGGYHRGYGHRGWR
jgi:hypothetical protein